MPSNLTFHKTDAFPLECLQKDIPGFPGTRRSMKRIQNLLHIISVRYFDHIITKRHCLGFDISQAHNFIIGSVNLQPVVASLVAIAVGQDLLTWDKPVAALLVLLGAYIVTK